MNGYVFIDRVVGENFCVHCVYLEETLSSFRQAVLVQTADLSSGVLPVDSCFCLEKESIQSLVDRIKNLSASWLDDEGQDKKKSSVEGRPNRQQEDVTEEALNSFNHAAASSSDVRFLVLHTDTRGRWSLCSLDTWVAKNKKSAGEPNAEEDANANLVAHSSNSCVGNRQREGFKKIKNTL